MRDINPMVKDYNLVRVGAESNIKNVVENYKLGVEEREK